MVLRRPNASRLLMEGTRDLSVARQLDAGTSQVLDNRKVTSRTELPRYGGLYTNNKSQ